MNAAAELKDPVISQKLTAYGLIGHVYSLGIKMELEELVKLRDKFKT